MIKELFPQAHVRLTPLPLLGPLLEDFAAWLVAKGLSLDSVRNRIRKAPEFETVLVRHGGFQDNRLTKHQLLALGPPGARDDMHSLSLVRSLADYLGERGLLAVPAPTPSERLLETYQKHLLEVRGLAAATVRRHIRLSRELLAFLEFDDRPETLRELGAPRLEGFIKAIAPRLGRAALQGAVSAVRVFLRFLASSSESAPGLDRCLALPRVYLAERLPRALPWETVRAFLAAIDRTAPTGRRDYAMLLMAAT